MDAWKSSRGETLTHSAGIDHYQSNEEIESIIVKIDVIVSIKPKNTTLINFSTMDGKTGSITIDKLVNIPAVHHDIVKIHHILVGTPLNSNNQNSLKHQLFPGKNFNMMLIERNGTEINCKLFSYFSPNFDPTKSKPNNEHKQKQNFDSKSTTGESSKSFKTGGKKNSDVKPPNDESNKPPFVGRKNFDSKKTAGSVKNVPTTGSQKNKMILGKLQKNFENENRLDGNKLIKSFKSEIKDKSGEIIYVFVDSSIRLVDLLKKDHWIQIAGDEITCGNKKARLVKHQNQIFYQGTDDDVAANDKPTIPGPSAVPPFSRPPAVPPRNLPGTVYGGNFPPNTRSNFMDGLQSPQDFQLQGLLHGLPSPPHSPNHFQRY
uniref:Uncharacterized protein n=1 Tax=Panagrolaimus sp. JU765 TaxID=591449 RepID=A0AC34PZD3_9BILA